MAARPRPQGSDLLVEDAGEVHGERVIAGGELEQGIGRTVGQLRFSEK
ncbi:MULTISPECIES: hypothetical protein [unclassified Nocardia]|nr:MULTISPECIES: hypothetical protein [unclassified Nocardia]